MSNDSNLVKVRTYNFVKVIVIVIVAIVFLLGFLLTFVWYSNFAAEKEAHAFCDEISIGSDISPVITKFEMQIGIEKNANAKVSARHYRFPQQGLSNVGHTFVFPGFMMDRAYCGVMVDTNGKVISKYAEMKYD